MAWLIIFSGAIVLGSILGIAMRSRGMGASVCIPIACLGAGLGGLLSRMTLAEPSPLAFYGLSLLLCLLSLGGGLYAFVLTGQERRV